MSLFYRQDMRPAAFGSIVLPEVRKYENGRAEIVYVDQAKIALPDASTTDLEACLAAGVPLKQVNSKVLGTQIEELELGLQDKIETKDKEA